MNKISKIAFVLGITCYNFSMKITLNDLISAFSKSLLGFLDSFAKIYPRPPKINFFWKKNDFSDYRQERKIDSGIRKSKLETLFRNKNGFSEFSSWRRTLKNYCRLSLCSRSFQELVNLANFFWGLSMLIY